MLALAGIVAGCVYYPTVGDVGGTRIRPTNGHLVREGDGALVYFELESTGKFGDVITAVTTPVARRATLVAANGSELPQLDVPGASTLVLAPGGPHVALSALTRPLVPGESIIVTLVFHKIGNVGVVTLVQ